MLDVLSNFLPCYVSKKASSSTCTCNEKDYILIKKKALLITSDLTFA